MPSPSLTSSASPSDAVNLKDPSPKNFNLALPIKKGTSIEGQAALICPATKVLDTMPGRRIWPCRAGGNLVRSKYRTVMDETVWKCVMMATTPSCHSRVSSSSRSSTSSDSSIMMPSTCRGMLVRPDFRQSTSFSGA